MNTTYITNESDTFESIARNVLGDDKLQDVIAAMNPGVGIGNPFLVAGLAITVPEFGPQVAPLSVVNETDSVTLSVEGVFKSFIFENWVSVRITRVLDGIDSAEFTAPFDPNDPDHREFFRPFAYKNIAIAIGGKTVFSGTMISVTPQLTEKSQTVTVGAYALPGVLQDCTAPSSAYPLEFNGLKLDEIARKLCEPFGIAVTFEEDAGPTFGRIAMSPGERVFSFLVKLAKQIKLIITSGADGGLVFKRSATSGKPVATLTEGAPPLLGVTGQFSQQEYYSNVTGITPPIIGNLGGKQYTVKNPRLTGKLRPITVSMNNVDSAEIVAATEARMGFMFGDAASYSAHVLNWRDPDDNLWEPNTFINVTAPGAMIYNETTFLIREVTLMFAPDQKQTAFNLVLPGAYSGQIPERLPWD